MKKNRCIILAYCILLAATVSHGVSFASSRNFEIIDEYQKGDLPHYSLICLANNEQITVQYAKSNVQVLENERCSGMRKEKGQNFVGHINAICDCVSS